MGWLILWFGLSLIAAVIAANKGRSAIGFFFLAFLLSPLVGIIAALVASPNTSRTEEKMISGREVQRCPYCAELVKSEAIVCKHCGRNLSDAAFNPTEEQWDRFVDALEKRKAKQPRQH